MLDIIDISLNYTKSVGETVTFVLPVTTMLFYQVLYNPTMWYLDSYVARFPLDKIVSNNLSS